MKTICDPSLTDIPVEDCITELTKRNYNDKTWDCDKCSSKFNCSQSRWRHEQICKAPSLSGDTRDTMQQVPENAGQSLSTMMFMMS